MKESQYAEFVDALFAKKGDFEADFNHAAMGCTTEAVELLDISKKMVAYGKPFDRAHAIEEAGDMLYYLAAFCNLLGITVGDLRESNFAKLSARYPDKVFKAEHALERKDKKPDLEVLLPLLGQHKDSVTSYGNVDINWSVAADKSSVNVVVDACGAATASPKEVQFSALQASMRLVRALRDLKFHVIDSAESLFEPATGDRIERIRLRIQMV